MPTRKRIHITTVETLSKRAKIDGVDNTSLLASRKGKRVASAEENDILIPLWKLKKN